MWEYGRLQILSRCSEMKCSSRLLCGLLMSWLCFRVTGSSVKLTAIQSPSSITVNEGESAQISCCWNKSEPGVIVKVAWHINKTKFEGVKEDLQERQTQNCSTLHLTNILKNYTGHWVCKVSQDIPVLVQWEGNGTDLSVRVRKLEETTTVSSSSQTTETTHHTSTHHTSTIPSPPPPHLTLHLSLAATVGLVTLCLAFSVCKMRNSCKKTERVVIHQMPNNEGEEHEHMEEEDGSTGSSRGSLQWYQVPVYWSYFDLQRGEQEQ